MNLNEQRIGETSIAKNGMKMTIIAYRTCHDIDIQFEDGTISKHLGYNRFKKGEIGHPAHDTKNLQYKNKRIGETTTSNCGMKMTIIAYRTSRDIDVQFENGTIINHRDYCAFRKGTISCPNIPQKRYTKIAKQRIGETVISNCGIKMTIIAYRKCHDIDIQLEDGTIIEHTDYTPFKNGSCPRKNHNEITKEQTKQSYIGQTNTAENGQKMTIIAWHAFHDIDVQFDDGTIVYNKRYDYFKRGKLCNPNKKVKRTKTSHKHNNGCLRDIRIGETNVAKNGIKMTIEEYRSATDLDVRFENGILVQHRAYKEFSTGNIGCPGEGIRNNPKRFLHETNRSTQGQMMEIIACNSNADMTIKFEDGTIVYHQRHSSFKKGCIRNPNYKPQNPNIGRTKKAKNGQMMTIINYNGVCDIDIKFEDGYIAKHKSLQKFEEGLIKNPNVKKKKANRIGLKNTSVFGIQMEVIKSKNDTNCDIEFETGYINKNKQYGNFAKGRIGHIFPWRLANDVEIIKPAYVHNNIGNFYCTCSKCGMSDIMTVSEMKQHVCQPS